MVSSDEGLDSYRLAYSQFGGWCLGRCFPILTFLRLSRFRTRSRSSYLTYALAFSPMFHGKDQTVYPFSSTRRCLSSLSMAYSCRLRVSTRSRTPLCLLYQRLPRQAFSKRMTTFLRARFHDLLVSDCHARVIVNRDRVILRGEGSPSVAGFSTRQALSRNSQSGFARPDIRAEIIQVTS